MLTIPDMSAAPSALRPPGPKATLPAVVRAMRLEAEKVLSIELCPAGPILFPPPEPGAHIDLHLPNGLVRSYSLIGPSADGAGYLIAVLHDRNSRGGSSYVHEQMRVGMTLPISMPRNNFVLDEAASASVLVAGGIGVTPMLSMLDHLIAASKPVDFIYCARSRREAAFLDEVDAAAADGVPVVRHFDDEQSGPPNLYALLADHAPDTHFYCCGPGPMLDAFEAACEAHGYRHRHVERFAPANPPASGAADGSYVVELRRSGKTVQVTPGTFLLDAILAAGVAHDHSCREGVCGACEAKVLAGEVDHRDSILTASERAANKAMMVCVSGCTGARLVLDI